MESFAKKAGRWKLDGDTVDGSFKIRRSPVEVGTLSHDL